MRRFGALVSLAPDGRPMGEAQMVLAGVDDDGVATAEWTETIEPGPQFDVVTFIELDDGTRVADTDAAPGHSQLGTWAGITRAELEDAVREMVFEDDIRDIAEHDSDVAEM
ncbi:MAG TPA: hypothetical protein VFR49_05040, partial [Solirubrobacteraceae bacterium]|nr:hypothetical protein [Solirubrobacteraceae bacterium]